MDTGDSLEAHGQLACHAQWRTAEALCQAGGRLKSMPEVVPYLHTHREKTHAHIHIHKCSGTHILVDFQRGRESAGKQLHTVSMLHGW